MAARGRPRGDAGYTLPELLIATAVTLVLLGGALTVTVTGIRSEPRVSERSAEIQQARVLMDRVTRELRQGATVLEATTGHLRLITYVSSETCGGVAASTARSCMVTYDCAAGTCTRVESDAEGTTSGPRRSRRPGSPPIRCSATCRAPPARATWGSRSSSRPPTATTRSR